MEEFPSNSQRSKEEPPEQSKRVEKIVTGQVIHRKKPLGKRFSEIFFGGDAKGVGNYVLMDVIIPAVKDTVVDALTQAVERIFFGENRPANRRGSSTPRPSYGHVNYTNYSGKTRPEPRREEARTYSSRRAAGTHSIDEIILATRIEAEEVVDRLGDLIEKYESASIADLYELVGLTGNFTDNKWGWTSMQGAGVARTRNGGAPAYLLDLPKPEPLS